MISSISWIDRDGLAQTLTRMGQGARPGSSRAPRLRSAASRGLDEPPAAPSLPSFEPPSGSLSERLEALLDWLEAAVGAHAAFIADHDGLALADRRTDADLLAIASSVMQLVTRLSSNLLSRAHAAVVQLDEGQLILLSVTTPIGPYIVGYVGRACPPREVQLALAAGVRRAFSPPTGERPLR